MVYFCNIFRAVTWDLKFQFDYLSTFINMSHWKIFTCLDDISASHLHFLIYPVVMCETLLILES